jgi:hypothetical protein
MACLTMLSTERVAFVIETSYRFTNNPNPSTETWNFAL